MTSRVSFALLPLLILLSLPAASALGQASEAIRRQAKDMSDRAAAHFAHQEWFEAAELFEQAYALDHDKLIRLRNAGRAFEEAGRQERALHCFVRYEEREEDLKLLADARQRIKRLRAALARPGKAAAPPQGAAPPQDAARPMPAASPKAAALKQPPDHISGGTLLAGGGGVVLLATGLIWVAATESAAGLMDEDVDARHYIYEGGDQKLADDRSTVRNNRIAAWSLTGLGTAGLATAVWLWLQEDTRTSWPTPRVGLNRLQLAWRF